MDRREFLKAGAAASLSPFLPPIDLSGSDPLVAACREGAAREGVAWAPAVAARVAEEVAELNLAKAAPDLLRIGSAVRRLRDGGGLIAPAWGRTGSSLVARLIGISTIDPLAHDIGFDLVMPLKDRLDVSLCIAIDGSQVDRFTADLAPESIDPYDPTSLSREWSVLHMSVIELNVFPVTSTSGPAETAGALREPLCRFLEAWKPRGVDDLALALALFRPGPLRCGLVESIFDVRAGRRPAPAWEWGASLSHGFPVFKEDLIQSVRDYCGVDRLTAAAYVKAAGAQRRGVLSTLREQLRQGAWYLARDSGKLMEMFDTLEFYAGYTFLKAHAVATASMLLGQEGPLRRFAMATSMAGSPELLTSLNEVLDPALRSMAKSNE